MQITSGLTERGCLSNLDGSDFSSCLDGLNSTNCSICAGDNCNQQIFPVDRRACHICSTNDDVTCETQPLGSTEICPKYDGNEKCVTWLASNGTTMRGCSSQLSCNLRDSTLCQYCDASGCNTVNLKRRLSGPLGLWQDLPLKCHSCPDKEGCASSSSSTYETCFVTEHCMTVFDKEGAVINRGCSDGVEREFESYCDSRTENCAKCSSNLCNSADTPDDYIDCVYCDSASDTECVARSTEAGLTRRCQKSCMTALYPRSGSSELFDLSRGCLDDKEASDQVDCRNDGHGQCAACDSASCNVELLPADRRSCYTCMGANCEFPTAAPCQTYTENDQCYMLFDRTNSIAQLGCVSDLNNTFVSDNIELLYLCGAKDNCNGLDNVPTPTSCAVCDSSTDADCAVTPNHVGSFDSCTQLPNTQCFTRIKSGGITERGCVNKLNKTEMLGCLTGNEALCSVCGQNGCNTEIYPTDRRTCHRCSSANDLTCIDEPQEFASVCLTYRMDDKCVSKLEMDTLVRGCASDFSCDATDRDSCRICESDDCNTVNLLAMHVGDPGRWQDLPLSCKTCSGVLCQNGITSLQQCENNNLQKCVTVFDEAGEVEKRGCSDDVAQTHGDYCDMHPEHCIACKSNACNNAKSLGEYVDCYFCDSANNRNCSVDLAPMTRTRKCRHCLTTLTPRISSNDTAYETVRSCLDDLEKDDQAMCLAGDNAFCNACGGERCNNADFPAERLECFRCDGDDCENIVSGKCQAYHPHDQCHVLFDTQGSIIKMGCRSDFDPEVVSLLLKSKKLLLCDGKHCNDLINLPTPQSCSVCDSESDVRCATNPNLVGNYTRCTTVPYTQCVTRIDQYGQTERGCMAALDPETFYGCLTGNDELCDVCAGANCNELDVYPANRLTCHQCNSNTETACSSSPNTNRVCPLYDTDDSCVTNLFGGVTTRGCSSSTKCDAASDARNCRTCTKPGCNTVDLERVIDDGEPGRWQDVPLECYTCNSAAECAELSAAPVSACEENAYQNCMTVFDDDGKVVQRGCSDTVEAMQGQHCNNNPEACFRCNSNRCNIAEQMQSYVECLACDTDANGDCVAAISNVAKTRKCHKYCMTALYQRTNETDNPSYGLTRTCLDDMEAEAQDDCLRDNNEYCQACGSGDKCNKVALPAARLSCNICAGEAACREPTASLCPTYRSNDKCYIEFDERSQVIAMGCRSQYSNSDADQLLRAQRLFLCNGDNCNTWESVPEVQQCALCNSRTDANCAVSPDAVVTQTTCDRLPYTACYSRVLPGGATERGCLSSLQGDAFEGCVNGTASDCEVCSGSICNRRVYPANRLRCHVCDSEQQASCEDKPDSESVCPLYGADDVCVTAYRSDVTYRGCSSSFDCGASNSRSCVRCSGDVCNTVNLARKQDDNFGKWQDLPLSCWTCDGEDCAFDVTTVTSTCMNNNEQDCMTVFEAESNGKVLARGCSDSIEEKYEKYCDENLDSCLNCKSNECNNAKSKTEYIDCVYCDTNKDLSCVWEPNSSRHKVRKCHGGCMTALYPSIESGNSSGIYDLVRTCLSDKEATDQLDCNDASSDGTCSSCTDGMCNIADVPVDRLSCYSCVGENCDSAEPQRCPLYSADDRCFIWFDNFNSITQMGCVSSFRGNELESLVRTRRVLVCSGSDCNTYESIPTAQQCAVCDSTVERSCAINALEVGNFSTCNKLPFTSCYSKIRGNSTIRGCLSDLPDDEFVDCVLGRDKLCHFCGASGCNREVYPADRQQCYVCDTDEDASCESYPSRTWPCAEYSDQTTCVTQLQDNSTFRGCSESIQCDTEHRSSCRTCIGSGCNSIDLRNRVDDGYHGVWQSLPLRCHACVGEHCHASLGPSLNCTVNQKEDCMTVFDEDGMVRRRGCSDDVEDYEDLYCRLHPHLCFKCKSNECNTAWNITDYVACAYCDSEQDARCITSPHSLSSNGTSRWCSKECMVALRGQQIIRSCLDDKELMMQGSCRMPDDKDCGSCVGAQCNTFNFPADRLACHVCVGSACAQSEAQYCQLYETEDYCFAKFENGTVDMMGCASTQSRIDLDRWSAQRKLFRCNDAECNALSRLPQSSDCVSCDSSKTPSCSQSPLHLEYTVRCDAPHSECMTRIDEAGNTIRGCLRSLNISEAEQCKSENDRCSVCTDARCNREVFPEHRRRCHICTSLTDTSCLRAPRAEQICPIYVANDRCVSRSVAKLIERGCLSELNCNGVDQDNCQICDTDNCNVRDFKNAAETQIGRFWLTFLAAIAVVLKMHEA